MESTHALQPADALETMRTQTVLVAGAGVAGRGVISMLCALGARSVLVADDNAQAFGDIADDGDTELRLLSVSEAIETLDDLAPRLVVTSPGWKPESPLLARAAELGIPVIGDIAAAWLADQAGAFGEPRTWLAVTGTNGKTTTTAMLTSMLIADGRAALAVGNIGIAPSAALAAQHRGEPRSDVFVAEVSSFQLHWAPMFEPAVGCILNLAEDHLDWHGNYENYCADKAQVLTAEESVLALDDSDVVATARARQVMARRGYTIYDPEKVASRNTQRVVGVRDGRLIEVVIGDPSQTTDLATAQGISPPGPAGLADAAASAAMARAVGVAPAAIETALSGFKVQAHRGQVVLEHGGVTWIDNSKATNPHAAEAALRGQRNVIWVAGGQLKGAAVDGLIRAIGGALKAVVALGVDRAELVAEVSRQLPDLPVTVVDATDPEEAMRAVARAAHGLAQPGDSVVLAPAAASLDMYTGMSQRGDLFAQYAVAYAGADTVEQTGQGNQGTQETQETQERG
ncbi:UDP-N-acetylmuramoyl-L-alanine--D-glutamate ligase [Corynebacterium sp. ACRQL]|uniref:UDP-N-acetylmuramoyl-L-alanine--D-glutamate ligase n=1 Tax=unclassified Corynebacterium TaxID=2624378 RepID=UPI00351CFA4B